MNKRELLWMLLEESPQLPYVPAAFFLHFPPEYHQGKAAAAKHLEFFHSTGMDLVKIQFESRFPLLPDLQTPDDWRSIPRYGEGFFQGQWEAVREIVAGMKKEAVVVVTLYSAFMCAGHTAGWPKLIEHLETEPNKVRTGLEIITESLLLFVKECVRLGVDGFYASTQGGEAARFKKPGVFEKSIKPFDLWLMGEVNRLCPWNILHVCDYWGEYEGLKAFLDYPGQVVSAPLRVGKKSLTPAEVAGYFQRPFLGGLDRTGVIAQGPLEAIRRDVREVIKQAPARFILGADCTVPNDTPWEYLKTAIDTAHTLRPGLL